MTTLGLHRLLAISVLIALTGCGGGGSSGSSSIAPPSSAAPPPVPQLPPLPPSPSPAPTSAAPYYLASGAGPFFNGTMNTARGVSFTHSQHLVVVDSASPTTPILLEVAGQWQSVAQIDEGVTDLATGSMSNVGERFVTYLKEGRVYRLDLRRANWPPTPMPVSALQTTDLCRLEAQAIQDRSSAGRSVLLFEAVGADRQCGTADDRPVAVRLDMSAADPPFTIEGQFLAAFRGSDGAVTGFVVRSGSRVQQIDANFANPVDLFTLSSPTNRLYVIDNGERPSAPHRQLLFVDGRDVRAFSLSSGSGPVTLFTLATGEFPDRAVASDANNVYLIVNGDRHGRLIRVSDALTATVIASESTSKIYQVETTLTRLVYLVLGAQSVEYRSVPKTGGTAITVAPGQPCPDLSRFFTVGETVWYDCAPLGPWDDGWLNPPQGLPVNPILGLVRSDGTQIEEFNNLELIGTSSVNPMPLRPDAAPIHSVIVANISASGLANATLRAFEGTSRRELFTYGILPSSAFAAQTVTGRPVQWGQPGLLSIRGHVPQQGANFSIQTDLFFYQSNVPGLTRVTAFVP